MEPVCGDLCKNEEIIIINKEKIKNYTELEGTADYYKLLGNQTRLKILLILLDNKLCVCDIAESIELSIPATSQQLKMLKQSGILTRKNTGKTVNYSFTDKNTEKNIAKLLKIVPKK